MTNTNTNLTEAKKCKNDEFYTLYEDIEKELSFYKDLLKNKVVYCNCDTISSNFVNYFIKNYKNLSLGGLIFTSIHSKEKYFYDGEWLKHQTMDSYGDFRSPECIELLKKADVVVTNPPFSLFREYLSQLIEYNKKFIIIGNINAITYKEIFPLVKDNKIWLGVSIHSGDREFQVPKSYPLRASGCRIDENGNKYIRVKVRWFTNLNTKKRHEMLTLFKTYTPEEYPKYDSYDAIEVGETKLIPLDYDGAMGVPITFIDKYCPEQFEIIGELHHGSDNEYDFAKPIVNGKEKYVRILVRNLNPAQSHHQNN